MRIVDCKLRGNKGAVLLEVVLALVLFVAAATIIGSGLSTSADGVDRLKLTVHGANLAASVLSELQIGVRTLAESGPEPFPEPFENWMWQLEAIPVETATTSAPQTFQAPTMGPPDLMRVEVIVRDTESDFVYRLSQTLAMQ